MVLSVWKDLPKYWVTLLRSSFIGCWLGITPGGAIAASFMGYNLAKRFSKDPDSFGKGRIEGVFAPETAAHASGTAALLPMLALGIPGSGTAAILLGGLMVWGLNPGPLLFVEHKDFVWGLIASMYLGNVVGLVLVLTTVPIFASILRVPFAAVAPMIVVSCAIGAYAIQNAMFDIWLMLGFGVVGYVFKKIGIPLAPFTLALVLGNRAEDAFRLSMIGSGGDMKVFWSNGLVGSITTLAIVLLFWPVIDRAFGSVTRRLRLTKKSVIDKQSWEIHCLWLQGLSVDGTSNCLLVAAGDRQIDQRWRPIIIFYDRSWSGRKPVLAWHSSNTLRLLPRVRSDRSVARFAVTMSEYEIPLCWMK